MMVPADFNDFPTIAGSTPTSSVLPIPTVIPGAPLIQELHATGKRTLWYTSLTPKQIQHITNNNTRVVTVLMGISSLAFFSLGARVPLVSPSPSLPISK